MGLICNNRPQKHCKECKALKDARKEIRKLKDKLKYAWEVNEFLEIKLEVTRKQVER
jgi:hypothetical protein